MKIKLEANTRIVRSKNTAIGTRLRSGFVFKYEGILRPPYPSVKKGIPIDPDHNCAQKQERNWPETFD